MNISFLLQTSEGQTESTFIKMIVTAKEVLISGLMIIMFHYRKLPADWKSTLLFNCKVIIWCIFFNTHKPFLLPAEPVLKTKIIFLQIFYNSD